MPSAEKSTLVANTLDSTALNERSVENQQDEKVVSENSSTANYGVNSIVSIVSNKVRNLEKRKNKLDGYKADEEGGKELSLEQQKAISKYDEVVQQLSLSKEFCKQFQKIANESSKEAKREARKTLFSRQHQEVAKVRDVLMIQDLLQRLKLEGVRNDFLHHRNGACPVNKAEMDFKDRFSQQALPGRPNFSNEPSFASTAKASAEVFSFLIDERNREFQDTGLTFEKGKELFNRIQTCGYWEKDVKFVEIAEEQQPANYTVNASDFERQDSEMKQVPAPAPGQVPAPSFNGNVKSTISSEVEKQQGRNSHLTASQLNSQNDKTTVTAVENAYFNHIKYSQQGSGQPNSVSTLNQNDFSTNFSFLQDSELDAPAGALGSQQQHKMPVKVVRTKHQQQMQQQSLPQQQFKNANFHPQTPALAAQMYPPGLKVHQQQNSVTHIPVNYQGSQIQLNQQNALPPSQVQSHMIANQSQPINGNQITGYGTQTPPIPQQSLSLGTAYATIVPAAQFQSQSSKPDQKVDVGDFKSNERDIGCEKDKNREEYQEQPQIDTWTNETAQTAGNGNYAARSTGGNFNRNSNRSANGGAKYNNYRNSQQSRSSFNENGSGDSPRENSAASNAAGTFFRNNERYNGSSSSGTRFENRAGAGNSFKPRDGNYRAGSGRFAGSASAAAPQGSSNPVQRK